jgi:putative endonuclease
MKPNRTFSGYVYFMANRYNTVLYIGVTKNLCRRVAEHKSKVNKGFTKKYNCDKLVYFEEYRLVSDAIAREKQLKNWKREWKDKLVLDVNTDWKDISEEIRVDEALLEEVKRNYEEIVGRSPQ